MNYVLTFLTLLKELRNNPKNPRVNLPLPLPNLLMPHLPHKSVLSVKYPGRVYCLELSNLGSFGNCGCARNVERICCHFHMNSRYYVLAGRYFILRMVIMMMSIDLCL